MKKAFTMVIVLMACIFSTIAHAGEFKVYPDASADEKATEEANKISLGHKITSTIYTTKDSFEKVIAFYKGIAREYKMPGQEGQIRKLPSGQELKEAYLIFDEAKDLLSAKLWIKIQHPYIGRVEMEGLTPKFQDIRDITSISVSERK